ncbi:hypothetical protein ECEC1846_2779, partial [Escherichia coli EC1846]|jgi:hypothetical protein
ML